MTKKIKISTKSTDIPFVRQTSEWNGIWGEASFFVNKDIENPDFWIVYNDIDKEQRLNCPDGCLILFTAEPESVQKYSQAFLNQFDIVVTSQESLIHTNKILSQTSLPWHIGRVIKNNFPDKYTRNYDELSNENIKKTKLISVITSNKVFTKGHKQRLDFVMKLKEHFGEKLDIYGRGINDFEDKWDVIAPYKYHIVLENTSENHYWTEKLADCYLGEAYPIYFGAQNLSEYFDKESFKHIDMSNFDEAVEIIENIILKDTYEKSLDKIKESKEKVLHKYNFFPYSISICSKIKQKNERKIRSIRPQNNFITFHKKAISKVLSFFRKVKLKYTLKIDSFNKIKVES